MRARKSVLAAISALIVLGACAKNKSRIDLSKPHRADQLLITLRGEAKSSQLSQILDKSSPSAQVESLNEDTVLITFPEGADLEEEAEKWSEHEAVDSIEANAIYEIEERIPNDPYFSKLWGLQNKGQQRGVIGADIGATSAWDLGQGSRRVLVGVIDSGIDYNHPDLAKNIWTNPGEQGLDADGQDKASNGVDDDGNGYVDDVRGWDFEQNDNDPMDATSHGTHVAGILGAVGNNGIGIAGVSWKVSMVPIKVFGETGRTSTDVIIRGLDYATKLGVLATNNSWGGPSRSEALLAAIKRAEAKGSLFVAAAGNDGVDNDSSQHFPSNFNLPHMISVAASNRHDKLASFSNFGANSVLVAAPGESIYSTLPENSYGLKSGASMATPHVTGLIAVLAARYSTRSPIELRKMLLDAATPLPLLRAQVKYGRLDAKSALLGIRAERED